ncbi:MAG: hypothetical protein AAB333_01345 [Pseudomonadota bacterium]
MVRLKDQSLGLYQINSKLAFSILGQLVAAGWGQSTDIFESFRRLEFGQPLLEPFGQWLAELGPHLFLGVAGFLQFP